MTRSAWVMIAVSALLAVAILTVGAIRFRAAAITAERAEHQLSRLAGDARELVRLRTGQAGALVGEPLSDDVLHAVHLTLTDLGLPESKAESLRLAPDRSASTRQSGQSDRTSGRRVRTYTLALRDIDPAELGMFLARWHETEPRWTPTRIELRAQMSRGQGRTPIGAAPMRYTATIDLSTVYVPASGPTAIAIGGAP